MEAVALQLKVENLGWEISRLDTDNNKLRAQHPERVAQVDAKRELAQAQGDVARFVEQVNEYEGQLNEIRQAFEAAEIRATEAEGRAAESDRCADEAMQ